MVRGSGCARTGKLEDLGGEIFKNRRGINGSFRAYADVVLRALLEVSVDTAHGELWRTRGSQLSEGLN